MVELLNPVKQRWSDMSGVKRLTFVVLLLMLLCLTVYGVVWLVRTPQQMLFGQLNPQDGAAVIAKLEQMKVPYSIGDDGKSILVSDENVYKTRMKLMGEGLHFKNTVGLELFQEADMGMTDFAQRVNYQRALQGELTRTIMGLHEVESARVHIVLPEQGLLRQKKGDAKASVTLVAKTGQHITPEQVQGIQRLVAASVPGIDADKVTIIDQRGTAISRKAATWAGLKGGIQTSQIDDALKIKQQTEEYIQQKVMIVLNQVLGDNQATLGVDVLLNHDLVNITREQILPVSGKSLETGAVLRERLSSQNAPTTRNADGSIGRAENTSKEVEFQYGKSIENIIQSPGSIERLSLSVVVPANTSPEVVQKIKMVVASTSGYNPARNDTLTVEALGGANELKTHNPLGELSLTMPNSAQTQSDEHANSSTNASTNASQPNALVNDSTGKVMDTPHNQPELTFSAIKGLQGLALVLFVVLAVCIGLIAMLLRKRTAKPKRLLPSEREALLQDIKTWLNQPMNSNHSGQRP